jgi:peptide/nickel transport system permease protein
MLLYVLKRFLLAIAIVFVSMVILFSLLHLVPGDPASIALGPRATPELIKAFRERLGLDEPLPVQMWRFFANLLSGDLGVDLWTNASVAQVTLRELPRTCALAAAGLGWAAILGVVLGCFSATRRNSRVDRLLGILSVGAIAMPSFVVAIYALLVFAVWLHWFPAIGAGPPGDLGLQLWHLALPAFALGLGWVGYIARLVRASMIEVLSENHIRTVRAYGLPQRRVVYYYALKLAILPTVTLLGSGVGRLLSGALFIEIVFNRPGIGKLVFDAVISRNYPVVLGGVLITTILFVLCTLVADLVAALLDPRLRDTL